MIFSFLPALGRRCLPPACFCLALLLAGCGQATPMREVFKKRTPYEKYQESLENTDLARTALGRDWITAGQQALRDSLEVTLPFRQTGYFPADRPAAYGFRFRARRGQRITVQVAVQAAEPVRLFLDVFEWRGTPGPLASADSAVLSFEVQHDLTHIVRLQPELLRSGRFTLTITGGPTLGFPVQGRTDKHVGSFWGDGRDGGSRRHEGIDIFAPRGTPALAAAAGTVRGVSHNQLGGKVVWLHDEARSQTLYYAHLDSQWVRPGQRVRPGDTLGLVGTTGNARFTAPHLHFGIYRWPGGPLDPYPFVKPGGGPPAEVKAPLALLGEWHRVAVRNTVLRPSPDARAAALRQLPRHTPLRVVGGTAEWHHVRLPSGENGYLPARHLEPARIPVQRVRPPADTPVTDRPHPLAAVIETRPARQPVSVLARLGTYCLVQTARHGLGWMAAE